MTQPPRFQVLLCTHNGERFLQAQLDSLQNQQLPLAAIVVHDWASSDGTLALLQAFGAQLPPLTAWRLVQHANALGPCASFLRAIEHTLALGEPFDYLLLCDQDDIWRSDKTLRIAQTIARQAAAPDLVISDVELIDAQGQLLAPCYLEPGGAIGRRPDLSERSTLFVNTVAGMSMGLSREFLLRHRSAWSLQGWFMHDWALCVVAHLSAARVAYIPESLVSYRQHGGNLLGSQNGQRRRPSLCAVWRQGREHVQAVHRQFVSCTRRVLAAPGFEPPSPWHGRQVAMAVIRARPFGWAQTLKVALGYGLWWPDP